VNGAVIDLSTNYEIYKRLLEKEIEKKDLGNLNNVVVPKYDVNGTTFRTLVESIALSTTSMFAYAPKNSEIRNKLAKKLGKSVSRLTAEIS
jgi:hypothetical protein